jgi:hypothetical protein
MLSPRVGRNEMMSPESKLMVQKLKMNHIDFNVMMQSLDQKHMTNSQLIKKIGKQWAQSRVPVER